MTAIPLVGQHLDINGERVAVESVRLYARTMRRPVRLFGCLLRGVVSQQYVALGLRGVEQPAVFGELHYPCGDDEFREVVSSRRQAPSQPAPGTPRTPPA